MITPRLALTAMVCGITLLVAAPVASGAGVTNPADHPYPVTITVGGQTYEDGRDTLPGYDDYLCTPIPSVEYDFASNEIKYYNDDGDLVETAPWTEWDRISSYDDWKKNQGGSSSSTPSKNSSSSSSSAAKGSTAAAVKAKAKAKAKAKSKAKSNRSKAKSKSSGSKSTGSKSKSKGSKSKSKSHKSKAAKSKAAGVESDTSTTSSSDNDDNTTAAASTSGGGGGNGPSAGAHSGGGSTRLAGIGILAALALGGLALVAGNAGVRKALDLRKPASEQRDPKIVTT